MMMRRLLISKHRSCGSTVQDTLHRALSSTTPPQGIKFPHIRPKASNNVTTFLSRIPANHDVVLSNGVVDQQSESAGIVDPSRPRASNPIRYKLKLKKYRKWSKNGSLKPKQTNAATLQKTTGNISTEQPKKSRSSTPSKKANELPEHVKAKKRFHHKELERIATGRFAERNLPTSQWVKITSIPPMSTLDDMLMSLQTVLDNEYDRGIIDLDADGSSHDEEESLVKLDPSTTWVQSARLVLSSHHRPRGWRLKLPNRSVVHSLLQYHEEHGLKCAWKPIEVKEWHEQEEDDRECEKKNPPLQVSDSMIRVECCKEGTTVDHVRHLFRRFDLVHVGASVTELQQPEGNKDKMFLVHFADPSWARAAIRELQGVKVRESQLLLAQYPRQIL